MMPRYLQQNPINERYVYKNNYPLTHIFHLLVGQFVFTNMSHIYQILIPLTWYHLILNAFSSRRLLLYPYTIYLIFVLPFKKKKSMNNKTIILLLLSLEKQEQSKNSLVLVKLYIEVEFFFFLKKQKKLYRKLYIVVLCPLNQ